MSKTKDWISPIGTTHREAMGRRVSDREYRAELERLTPLEALARIVIRRRRQLGLTQAQLAGRMGTSHSAISRIESGQHATTARTLKKLAEGLDARAVLGIEFGSTEDPDRQLVVL